MRKERTIRPVRLLWPLLLGVGLAVVLLLALMPHQRAQAQGPEPDVTVGKWSMSWRPLRAVAWTTPLSSSMPASPPSPTAARGRPARREFLGERDARHRQRRQRV